MKTQGIKVGDYIRILKNCPTISIEGNFHNDIVTVGEIYIVVKVIKKKGGDVPVINTINGESSFLFKFMNNIKLINEYDYNYYNLLSDSMFDQKYIAEKFFKDNEEKY